MSDPVMMPCHLPDAYIDAVLSFHAQRKEEEDPVVKALFGWVLPASLFTAIGDNEEELLSDKINEQSDIRRRKTQDSDIIGSKCEISKKSQEDIDEESVQTQSTAESNGWDGDSCDDDWDDTRSIDTTRSDDEGPLAGEKVYDDWFSVTTLNESDYDEDGEGHHYFTPSPEDFPQIRRLQGSVKRLSHPDRAECADSTSKAIDFWEETKRNIDSIFSSADQAIKELFQQGDNIRKKLTHTESFADKAPRSRPTELEAAKAAPPSRSMQPVISMKKVQTLNEVAKVKVKETTKKVILAKSQTHDNLAQYFNTVTEGNACRSMVRTRNTLAMVKVKETTKKVMLVKSQTHDNLAQYFNTVTEGNACRSMIDKTDYTHKQMMHPSSGRKLSKAKMPNCNSKSVPVKPTHRRTRSQRLIPSALDHNDFPWY